MTTNTPPTSWQAQFPFAEESVAVGRHRLAVYDVPGDGPPVLCVHGNPTWAFYYRAILAGLPPAHRVLAVDHLGMGRSDKPPATEATADYTLAGHIRRLVAVIEAKDLRDLTLVVHDWGGAIGLGAALEVPDRIGRLLILNTAAFPPPYVPWRIAACRVPVLGTAAMRGLNLFARAATVMAVEDRRRLDKTAATGLLAPYDDWAHRVGIDRFVHDIPLSRSHPTHATLTSIECRLATLADRPVSLVWGMKDWCFRPECLTRFETIFPTAQVVRLPEVGHYVMEEAPDTVLAELRALLAR